MKHVKICILFFLRAFFLYANAAYLIYFFVCGIQVDFALKEVLLSLTVSNPS